jgi:hypothetical protein
MMHPPKVIEERLKREELSARGVLRVRVYAVVRDLLVSDA